jgi:hypothetical protein
MEYQPAAFFNIDCAPMIEEDLCCNAGPSVWLLGGNRNNTGFATRPDSDDDVTSVGDCRSSVSCCCCCCRARCARMSVSNINDFEDNDGFDPDILRPVSTVTDEPPSCELIARDNLRCPFGVRTSLTIGLHVATYFWNLLSISIS